MKPPQVKRKEYANNHQIISYFFQGISQQQLQDHTNEIAQLEEKQNKKDNQNEKDPLIFATYEKAPASSIKHKK